MRYVVTVVHGFETIKEFEMPTLGKAIAKEAELRKIHGTANVWITHKQSDAIWMSIK